LTKGTFHGTWIDRYWRGPGYWTGVAEKPDLIGTIILLVAIPETVLILGFAVAAMIILLLA
jgi:F0F1-type ATP synthase membrane subunit c/vacuolar-type H+-ATPase subunit K